MTPDTVTPRFCTVPMKREQHDWRGQALPMALILLDACRRLAGTHGALLRRRILEKETIHAADHTAV
jgi:hypothetical protein